jgi:hypothetical protein
VLLAEPLLFPAVALCHGDPGKLERAARRLVGESAAALSPMDWHRHVLAGPPALGHAPGDRRPAQEAKGLDRAARLRVRLRLVDPRGRRSRLRRGPPRPPSPTSRRWASR